MLMGPTAIGLGCSRRHRGSSGRSCGATATASYLTADHWESFEAFERFQAGQGEQYRRLDAELEGLSLAENFLGAYDLVQG